MTGPFAQFEREVTGERIRDKIAASKAKGMWMGGMLPLGYDLKDRTLVINAAEAQTVRTIFQRYLKLGSVRDLKEELERKDIRSKVWVTRKGDQKGGAPFSRGALYHLLQSRLYIGEIVHGDKRHRGQHPAIIETKLFEAVERKLAKQRTVRRASMTRAAGALLTGRLFDADGEPMSPSFSYGKSGRLYRYYIAMALQRGERPARDGAVRRVGAEALERFMVEAARRLSGNARLGEEALLALLRRVELRQETTHLLLEAQALGGEDHPDLVFEDLQERLATGERALREQDPSAIRVVLPVRMQLRGGRTFLDAADGASNKPRINPALIHALRSAHAELRVLNASPLTAPADLSQARAPNSPHRRQLSKLAFLAPDLQRSILEGSQPRSLTLRTLLRVDLPLDWEAQRRWFEEMERPAPRRPSLQTQGAHIDRPQDREQEPGAERAAVDLYGDRALSLRKAHLR